MIQKEIEREKTEEIKKKEDRDRKNNKSDREIERGRETDRKLERRKQTEIDKWINTYVDERERVREERDRKIRKRQS